MNLSVTGKTIGEARIVLLVTAFGLLVHSGAWAQAFDSGSTGADSAFNPTANTTLTLPPDGVFNFTTVNVPAGVTVTFTPNVANTPVTMLATGDVTVGGTISLNGNFGVAAPSITPAGPGGFPGGTGGASPAGGSGPGGGLPSGAGGTNATYGAPGTFVTLLPLFGGSGGGGGIPNSLGQASSGGSGGGAIVIASTTRIIVTGSITANGGGGTDTGGNAFRSGAGSGGAIRLVAPEVSGTGSLSAVGGFGGSTILQAGPGRTRIEATTDLFTGSTNPTASRSSDLGPVTTASTPSTANLPALTFSSVAGFAAPVSPTGSYAAADISLPPDVTNPVSILLTTTNIPVGTVFTVKVIPQVTDPTTFFALPTSGTFSHATTTANVTIPPGEVSQLLVFGSFTVPEQLTGLYPLIDGEPVDRVMVAAAWGKPSTVTYATRTGKVRSVRNHALATTGRAELAAAGK